MNRRSVLVLVNAVISRILDVQIINVMQKISVKAVLLMNAKIVVDGAAVICKDIK